MRWLNYKKLKEKNVPINYSRISDIATINRNPSTKQYDEKEALET